MSIIKKLPLIIILICLKSNIIFSQFISVGKGSYTNKFPGTDVAGRNSVPSGTPFVTGKVKNKPIPTNDWWSAKIKNAHCDNLFNYPLTLKTTPSGLVTSYIPWGVISDILPIVSGVKGLNSTAANISNYSDWHIEMEWSNNGHRMQAVVAMGIPFVYYQKDSADVASITLNTGTVTINDEIITIENAYNGADFAVYAPSGSSWTQNGKVFESDLNGKNYWSIIMLPKGSGTLLNRAVSYQKYAYVEPTNTSSSFSYDSSNSVVTTHFEVEYQVHEGTDSMPLIGLLPHQWSRTSLVNPKYIAEFSTVRGALKLIDTNAFEVKNTFKGILPTLPYVDLYSEGFDPELLNKKIQSLQYDGLSSWTDSYNEGQVMNRLIQSARIAHEMGNHDAVNTIKKTVKARLEDWLSAESNEVAFLFHYSKDWTSLIGYPAGHGQDGNLNDHHFHWGYFIHAAAFLEEFEPGWAKDYGEMVNLLVRDAASYNRNDSLFPFLRNFNPYGGHCWANGFASFPQGNDQESTSESMQFNSSLIHWGSITGNKAIRDLGIYLYTTEQSAIEEYWFDTKDRNFGSNQNYALVSRVWGNSYDNGTFWTNDIAASYGIELYPIHGGSFYLYHDTNYAQKLWKEMAKNTGILTNQANDNLWHDVYWKFLAFQDAPKAIQLYNSYANRNLKFGISDAQTYHWLHALNALGTLQSEITANHPLAVVFKKDTQLIYVAKNYSSDTLKIQYSNGFKFTVPPHKLKTSLDADIHGTLNSQFNQVYKGGSTLLTVDSLNETPSKIVLYYKSKAIDSLSQSPYKFKVENLGLGLHTYYVKIFKDQVFSTSNFKTIQVGDQIPYGGNRTYIPGIVQSGLFDEFEGGIGQGISYQDASSANLGDFRLSEQADVTKDPNEGAILTWIDAGEWTEYSIEVEKDGIYEVEIRYSNGNNGSAGPLNIEQNEQQVAKGITFPSTGKWETFGSVKSTLPLKKGNRVLRLDFEGAGMNLSTLSFKYIEPITDITPTADAGGNKAQSKDNNSITLDGSNSTPGLLGYINYKWNQVYGPTILSVDDENLAKPTFTGLVEGTYKFKLTVFDSLYSDYSEILVLINDGSNIIPTAKLTQPQNNQTFIQGQIIPISVTANDADGKISHVKFWINNVLFFTDSTAPYTLSPKLTKGDYTVGAIAYDDSGSSVNTETINIKIFSIVGSWKLAPKAGALGVGPSKGNLIWWSNSSGDLNTRNCLFDDIYHFDSSGKFQNILGETTWLEGWQNKGTEACGKAVAPHDGMTNGTWEIDSINGSIIINGKGLYLGLPKATNTGDLSNSTNVPTQRIYEATLNANSLTTGIDYGSGYWNFEMVRASESNSNRKIKQKNTLIFPNPVSNKLMVQSTTPIKSFIIMDLSGRIYQSNQIADIKSLELDFSKLSAGSYILVINGNSGKEYLKVVKQ